MSDEFDFYSEEHEAMLRPTPCLKFKIIFQPQPHLGENISAGLRVLHQMHENMNTGATVWLPVELEED